MADKKSPTILVKKADGTYVRMTLDEFRRRKSAASPAGVADPPVTPQSPRPPDRPVRAAAPPAAPPLPSVAAKSSARPREDASRATGSVASQASSNRMNEVNDIIGKLSFKVSPENVNRLRTIVQFFLKDIRTAEQTRSTLLRPVLEGGMGFTEAQADEVMRSGVAASPAAVTETFKFLPRPPAPAAQAKKTFLPAVRSESAPAVSVPYNGFVYPALRKATPPAPPEPPTAPEKKKIEPPPVFRLAAAPKQTMNDVEMKPVTYTPVEEIKAFTLTDFRRLSGDPAEAAKRFRQKFTNLKDESILLYLGGLQSWRECPLYSDYLAVVIGALAKGEKLEKPSEKKFLQFNELKAIVAFEGTLEYL